MSTSLRICVAGAGAIGGVLATLLAQAGHDVSVLARGATLAAIRAHGLNLTDPDGRINVRVKASDVAEFGVQDVVFISAKAHSLESLLPAVLPLIGADTIVVPTLNGIPWWYFQGDPGRFDGEVVRAVDPQGALLAALDWRAIIGAVVYLTADTPQPGCVVATPPYRIILGEPSHLVTPRLQRLSAIMQAAGIEAVATDRIRDEIWTKLVANLASNPLSVVAEATLEEMFGRPELREVLGAVMREAMLVGASYGARITIDPLRLMEIGRLKGAFKTSMLQDYEKQRPLELAGIGDAVVELAARYEIPMQATRTLLSLTRFRAQRIPSVAINPEQPR